MLGIGCDRSGSQPVYLPEVISPVRPFTLDQEPTPKTLEEALNALDRGSSGAVVLKMRSRDESVTIELHETLGLWIRNSWGLNGHYGLLYQDLSAHGLSYADDMSAVILTSWWRHIHREPLNLEEQVARHNEFNETMRLRLRSSLLQQSLRKQNP